MDLAALLRDPNATPSPMPRSRVGGGGGGKNLRKDASANLRRNLLRIPGVGGGAAGGQSKKESCAEVIRSKTRRDQGAQRAKKKDLLVNKGRQGLQDIEDDCSLEESVSSFPAAAAPSTSRGHQQLDRRQKLQQFLAKKKQARLAERKGAKPAFRTGVYKLENAQTAKLPRSTLKVNPKIESVVKKQMGAVRPDPSQRPTAKSSRRLNFGADKPPKKEPGKKSSVSNVGPTIAGTKRPARLIVPSAPVKIAANIAAAPPKKEREAGDEMMQDEKEEEIKIRTPVKKSSGDGALFQALPSPVPTPKSSRRSIRQMGRRSVKLADLLSTSLSKSKEDDSGSDSNDVPQNVSKKLEFSDENESNDETAPKPMSADTPMSLTPASGKSRGSSAINRKRNRNAKVKGTPFPNRNKNPRKSILKSASKFASETVSSAGSDMDTPVKKRMKPNSGTSLTPFLSSMQVSQQDPKNDPTLPPSAAKASPSVVRFQTTLNAGAFNFGGSSAGGNPSASTKDFKFTASPKKFPAPSDTATPDSGANMNGFLTPQTAVKRSRKARRSEFTGLLDELRHDLVFKRGSNSSRKRAAKGKDPFNSVLPDLDLDGIPDDPFSPLHDVIKQNLARGIDNPLQGLPTPLKAVSVAAPGEGLDDSLDSNAAAPPRGILRRKSVTVRQEIEDLAKDDSEEEEGPNQVMADSQQNDGVGVKEVPFFRNLIKTQSERLTELCDVWDAKLETLGDKASDEVVGQIRSTIGKARLFMFKKGRFEQFKGLVDNCEFGTGDKPTTCSDLQGFWDMIYYQIEDVDAMFKDLCELEANDWIPKVVEEPSKRDNVNKTKKTFKAKARKSPVKGSNSLKAMMAAKRKEMKENAKNASAPMANAEEDGSAAAKKLQASGGATPSPFLSTGDQERLFDGGFFSVRSPLRKITPKNSPSKAEEIMALNGSSSRNTPSLTLSAASRSARKMNLRSSVTKPRPERLDFERMEEA